jgi:hypothetical protein
MTTPEVHTAEPLRALPSSEPHFDSGAPDRLTVPYAGQTRMRLTVTSGMKGARIRVDRDATALVSIDCGASLGPRVRESASELRVSWPATFESWLRGLFGADRDVDVALHPAVEWSLQIRGGLSHFEAELACARLERLEISGGICDARIDLPAVPAVVPIQISGGVSHLALCRPCGTGVQLAVRGGIAGLVLDDQHFEAIGGLARLESGLVDDAGRYAVEISGGASDLRVASGNPAS